MDRNEKKGLHSHSNGESGDPGTIKAVPESKTSISIVRGDKVSELSESGHLMQDEDVNQVQRIASNIHDSVALQSRIATESDPVLNPEDKSFSAAKWMKTFMEQLAEEGINNRGTGLALRNLSVYGRGPSVQTQETVASFLAAPLRFRELLSSRKAEPRRIIHSFEGLLKPKEILLVLGRPGSGCSTLLKTLTGHERGLEVGPESRVHFDGIPQVLMWKKFHGEVIYNDDVDVLFPHLTVYQTIEFAAASRVHQRFMAGSSSSEAIRRITLAIMAMLGLNKVANELVVAVSDGERRRISVAEMFVSGALVACWDHSTRGLDSATALQFIKALRLVSDLSDRTNIVATYKTSESMYGNFDKVSVLYEGRQIYFGPTSAARKYFEDLGWYSPPRQTTASFLTYVTNPAERRARQGFESKVPRTPEEFAKRWRGSDEYRALQQELDQYEQQYSGDRVDAILAERKEQKRKRQGKHVSPESAYTVSLVEQIRLNFIRQCRSFWNNKLGIVSNALVDCILALICGSVFFDSPDTTAGFLPKGGAMFLIFLLNALSPLGEFPSLWATRPIVRKHASYAFYHPGTEAVAGLMLDLPMKFVVAAILNPTAYFMVGLRATASQFFLFFLVNYTATFIMAAGIRVVAMLMLPINQAMSIPANLIILTIFMYSGFLLTVPNMHPWFSWIRWVNPLHYAFEILISNEFHGRDFVCSGVIPPYASLDGEDFICPVPGANAGEKTVRGDNWIYAQYRYSYSHVWRNYGIMLGFFFALVSLCIALIEYAPSPLSKANAAIFRRGRVPAALRQSDNGTKADEEAMSRQIAEWERRGTGMQALSPQKDVFTWRDIVCEIGKSSDQTVKLLDHVSGWSKPGTMTALMGVSGVGKTTLLNSLSQRTTVGVVSGDILLSGKPLSSSFQRKTAYAQQEDMQLDTATIRETLRVSAMLRQPSTVSKSAKYSFVEEVIKMLGMEDLGDVVIGKPGAGLTHEQRRLLNIGVELASRPKLIFLDEPTDGLDSQSSWAIFRFIRKLADSGQAVLCAMHQPSALEFEMFDRLLFLTQGGRTVYFGDIGPRASVVLDYFRVGGTCGSRDNPAEFLLDMVNKVAGDDGDDWPAVWDQSQEKQAVVAEIERLSRESLVATETEHEIDADSEFAVSFLTQLQVVTYRIAQQFWRSPLYVWSKLGSCIIASLYIGFSFYDAEPGVSGVQNVSFALVMITVVFTGHAIGMQPFFLEQRALYEKRDGPAKLYSWGVFIISNIVVEIPYQILCGILIWACFYYPVVGVQSSERQGLILLFVVQLFIYASTVAHMCIAALPNDQVGSALVRLLTIVATVFAGVLQLPDALHGFWTWMYHLSPFTYWIGGVTVTALAGREVQCSEKEMFIFNPPSGQSCGEYLAEFLEQAPGYLENPPASTDCRYCSFAITDAFLAGPRMYWSERWRDSGLLWAYVVFNVFVALLSYYVVRVKRWHRVGVVLTSFRRWKIMG